MSLPENTRIEITIHPWAVKAQDGSTLAAPITGLWFTNMTPLYSSPLMLEAVGGQDFYEIPRSIMKLAIYEASIFVDKISNSCSGRDNDYFKEVRKRYVTLKALVNLAGQMQGLRQVVKKVLGDFEIQFGNKIDDRNILSRWMHELEELFPVISSGGCLGIGTSQKISVITPGVHDPYRPAFGRLWDHPVGFNSSGVPGGKYNQSLNNKTSKRANYWRKWIRH